MNRTCHIFLQFLRRDLYAERDSIITALINLGLIRPILFGLVFGYLQANATFSGGNQRLATIFFAGGALLLLLVVAFKSAVTLLRDLEQSHFLDYQMTLLSPRLVLAERIVFATLYTFALMIPFYPVSKIVMGSYLDCSNTSWPAVFFITFIASTTITAYKLMAICFIKGSESIARLWMRFTIPLLILGGQIIPLQVMYEYSPLLGRLALLNPFIYVTEGIRQAFIGGPEYLSLTTCTTALVATTCVFIYFTFYFFKKKVDHI